MKKSINEEILNLERQHKEIDDLIKNKYKDYEDDNKLSLLKRQKLRLKQKIENLKNQIL